MTFAAGLTGFAVSLRNAGLRIDPARVQTFLAATEHARMDSPAQLYWVGRLTLCSEPDDIAAYDFAFESWFRSGIPRADTRARGRRRAVAASSNADDGAEARGDPHGVAASAADVLRRADIAELDAAQRAHLRTLLTTLDTPPPRRRALRHRPATRGHLDPRRTLRILLRGGEPARLAWRDRAERPRKVTLLIDISGSMSPYADALLRFAHVATRRAPSSTEVFTVGTRLTRVTRALRQRDPERAVLAATHAVPDYAGGTRLGEMLRAFLDRWGQRSLARGAVVVVFSDGWERGDASVLGAQMARLRRFAHQVLWANPHAGSSSYEPVQSGIRAALPHIDQLVAGHSVDSLQRLWKLIN